MDKALTSLADGKDSRNIIEIVSGSISLPDDLGSFNYLLTVDDTGIASFQYTYRPLVGDPVQDANYITNKRYCRELIEELEFKHITLDYFLQELNRLSANDTEV